MLAESAPVTAVHVLVPVKALRLAKTRLADVLDPALRSDLVVAMLVDTLTAVDGVDGAVPTVVTSDPVVARAASAHGARVVPDPVRSGGGVRAPGDGLNAAITAAADAVRARDDSADLIALQADLPALRTWELASALAEARHFGRAVVPDHSGTGTTALLHCRPGTPLLPSFGPGSAARHIASGAVALTADRPGLRRDVDTVDDLAAVERIGAGAATVGVLERIRVLTEAEPNR